MSILTHPLTYADLKRIRETRKDRLELIEGEIIVSPSPSPVHQRVTRRLNRILERVVIDTGLGEFFSAPLDVVLTDGTIVQPDIMVVIRERIGIITDDGIEGSPDFVAEVLSPTNRAYDRLVKRSLYALYGVPEYWLIDPERKQVTIYSDLVDGRYRSEHVAGDTAVSATIPNLSVELTALFAEPFADRREP
jgi:Uma2 family endonuclease